jgi:hypothetical protein
MEDVFHSFVAHNLHSKCPCLFLHSSLGSHDRGSYQKEAHTHTHSYSLSHTQTHTHTHVVPIASRCLASLRRSKGGEKSSGHQNCSAATFFIILHFFLENETKTFENKIPNMFSSYLQLER